jgi:homoserine kinase
MAFYLTIDAEPAPAFHITATGRNAGLCADADTSIILTTYRDLLPKPIPIALTLHNEIPLGMGCGSSAAALLAGVQLANHFGQLGWSPQQVLEEACRREGHPDNVAACFHGGMTSSAIIASQVITATCGQNLNWNLILALPSARLAGEKTEKARALLPPTYSRADAVANIQSTALLVSAFALDRPDLLRHAMRDRLHQPYRMEACPLLPRLSPMVEDHGVALSGAGPSVLLIADPAADLAAITTRIHHLAEDPALEVIVTTIAGGCVTVP